LISLKVIFRNTASNWLGLAINILIQFFLTPFIIISLGDTKYGVWTLIMSLTGYYGLFDFGIRSGVGHYITRYYAKNEIEKVNNIISSAFFILLGAAILCIIMSVILAFNFLNLFHVENISTNILRWSIIIVGINLGLTFPFAIFNAILASLQRFDIQNIIGITTSIIQAILVVIILKSGYHILGLAIVSLIVGSLGYILQYAYSAKIFLQISVKIKYFSLSYVKQISNFGIFSFLLLLSHRIISYTDSIIIGVFLNVTAITYFTIPRMLIEYLSLLISGFTQTLTPIATLNDALDNKENLLTLFKYGSRFNNSIIIPIFLILFCWGDEFLSLWIGEKYLSGEIYASSGLILKILLSGAFFKFSQRVSWQILFGMRQHRIPAIYTIFEALANLLLSVLLVGRMGLVGVALGTMITSMVTGGILIPIYSCRKINIKLMEYFTVSMKYPIFMGIIFAFSLLLSDKIYPNCHSWTVFIIKVFISLIFYFCLAMIFNIKEVKSLNIPEKLSAYKKSLFEKKKYVPPF
jgi:O-antigen/teichoic acid export membrane protein